MEKSFPFFSNHHVVVFSSMAFSVTEPEFDCFKIFFKTFLVYIQLILIHDFILL